MTLSNLILGELPLVIFTSIAQAAVGLSGLYALFAASKETVSHKKFGIYFLVLMIVGVVASILHLGDPFHAPYMILRMVGFSQNGVWVPSWLPLEILGIGMMVCLGAVILLKRLLLAMYVLPFVGVAMLFAMSNIYGSMEATVPTWNFSLTFFLFVTSAILLGGFTYRAFFAETSKEIAVASMTSTIGFAGFALALILYTVHNATIMVDGIEDVFMLMHGYYSWFIGSSLVFIAIALIIKQYACHMHAPKVAFVVALLGVFMSRVAFYGLITTHAFIG